MDGSLGVTTTVNIGCSPLGNPYRGVDRGPPNGAGTGGRRSAVGPGGTFDRGAERRALWADRGHDQCASYLWGHGNRRYQPQIQR